MGGLDGSEHGISPTGSATPLVFHGSHTVQMLYAKVACWLTKLPIVILATAATAHSQGGKD